ncbi:MAG: UDP-3-O-acyl-N-acetylglucosamine deacetylase [Spirochaetia bacterium]|nr:UDP-3-O-acyl-N-acetylglucosamine deacetylase [Spirochaetia bacterium]
MDKVRMTERGVKSSAAKPPAPGGKGKGAPKIVLKGSEIRNLTKRRQSAVLVPPDSFTDNRFAALLETRAYAPDKPVVVKGTATFENRPVTIHLSKQRDRLPCMSYAGQRYPLDASLAVKGYHNIQLGEIKIIEHPLAMMTGLNLMIDFALSESSFPTFDYCNRAYLDALAGTLVDAGEVRKFTVRRPVALKFGGKGYLILEEDDGSGAFVVDHQVSYPGTSVGKSRIAAQITPSFLAFACAARTPSFHPRADALRLWEASGSADNKGPFTRENVLLLDEERIYNARDAFLHNGVNYEFMLHEILDVIAWIKFVEARQGGRFSGRMTSFLFDHHAQVDAARYFCSDRAEEQVGFRWL